MGKKHVAKWLRRNGIGRAHFHILRDCYAFYIEPSTEVTIIASKRTNAPSEWGTEIIGLALFLENNPVYDLKDD